MYQDNGVTREETKSEAIKNFPITNARDPDSMRKTGSNFEKDPIVFSPRLASRKLQKRLSNFRPQYKLEEVEDTAKLLSH